MADDTPMDSAPVTFNVKSSSDAKYTLTVPLSMTVLELKQNLSTQEYAAIEPERQRLIYSGRVLKDHETIDSYKIKEGHTIHLVKGAASSQRQNPASQGPISTPTPSGVPTNIAAGTGNNPLAGLTGARYAGFAQLPNQNMFGPDGGMGPPPDPETMITMLQNPQFASTLNEALQNPQILDMMINQNPQLRSMGPEVRQMMQTPEFRRMMTDPEQLRNMTRLGRMFGAGGLPGMPGSTSTSAFPAPGNTDEAAGEGAEGNRAPTQPPLNPLASLFGMPFNPAAFGVPPPPAGTPATTTGTTRSSSRGATPSTDRSSTPSQQPPTPQQPTNPFTAANPFLANPALMQQMLQAMNTNATAGSNPYEAIFGPHGLLGGAPGAGAAGAGGAGAGGAFGGLPGFGWGNLGAGAPAEQAPVVQDTRPPEERYEQQLRQLNEMGFYEFERNVEALRRTGGSVEGAVEYLLTH